MNLKENKYPIAFLWFAVIFLAFIFTIENINHRFWLNDFKVYYGAAQAFLAGTQVYGILFALGSGYYKYSPFVILLVIPFALFSYSIASVLQYVFLSATIISLMLICGHIINKYLYFDTIKTKTYFLLISFICVVNHFIRELHLGNINVVLLFFLCLSLLYLLKSRQILAGLFLALVIITKPFFALLFLPLLLHKKWKALFSTGIFTLLFIILPALYIGMTKNFELHKEWFATMLEHNSSFQSYNTIDNLARTYIYSGLPNSFQTIVIFVVCIVYLIVHFAAKKTTAISGKGAAIEQQNLILVWFTMIAIMPSIFRTDTQHFLLSLPLIMILLVFVGQSKNKMKIALFVLLIFFYGGNTSELIGKKLSTIFDAAGFLGISNLVLIGVVVGTFSFGKKRENSRNDNLI